MWQTGTYVVLPCPNRTKKKSQASLLLHLLSTSIHNLCLIFILQTKACQVQCCSCHSHVFITFMKVLNKEKKNGFVNAVLWKQKNEPLCSQRKEFFGSHFIPLPARPWSLCSCIHSNHLACFWRPALTLLLVTSSNRSFVREVGNAPSHRAPAVKAVLPQLTKYLKTWENEGR